MNMYNNYDDNDSDNGSKERFNERLKTAKYRKGNFDEEDDDKKNVSFFRNIFKIFLALPSVVYTHVVIKSDKVKLKEDVLSKDIDNDIKFNTNDKISDFDSDIYSVDNDKNISRKIYKMNNYNKIKSINTRKYKNIYNNNITVNNSVINDEVLVEKEKLQIEIINLIKKRLVECVNELEMYESEFYLLLNWGVMLNI